MTFPDVQRDRPLTAAEVHAFLRSPSLVAHRMRELTDLSFVTDYLLRGSASATAGSSGASGVNQLFGPARCRHSRSEGSSSAPAVPLIQVQLWPVVG